MKPRNSYHQWQAVVLSALIIATSGVLSARGETLFASVAAYGQVIRYTPDGKPHVYAAVTDAGGLAFDQAGNLFVADYNESIIYRFTPTGEESIFAEGNPISNPSKIIFDELGNLIVAHNGTGPGIARIAPDGSLSNVASRVEASGLVFDSEGNLFATDYISENVLEFAPDGTRSVFATDFGQPADLAFDSSGNLFVSDLRRGAIYKITPDGTKSTFASGLMSPEGLAIDSEDHLFVAVFKSILEFTPDGARSTFDSGNHLFPIYLAFRPDNR
ncbi:MAG TPA: hypothetical protein VH207_10695 [Chthoniobacterales bacterium]|jgi:sugar lactone lactonase YvrE|nr:hypothetical protein [Chthoniobacterales bacterium]